MGGSPLKNARLIYSRILGPNNDEIASHPTSPYHMDSSIIRSSDKFKYFRHSSEIYWK